MGALSPAPAWVEPRVTGSRGLAEKHTSTEWPPRTISIADFISPNSPQQARTWSYVQTRTLGFEEAPWLVAESHGRQGVEPGSEPNFQMPKSRALVLLWGGAEKREEQGTEKEEQEEEERETELEERRERQVEERETGERGVKLEAEERAGRRERVYWLPAAAVANRHTLSRLNQDEFILL